MIFALAVLLALSACAASPGGGGDLDDDAVKGGILARASYRQGRAYSAKRQYDLAIREYDEAIRLQPDFLLAYLRRGGSYRNKGLTDRAITDYSKAIEVAPDYARAYYHRGQAYTFKGTYDRAIADFKKPSSYCQNTAMFTPIWPGCARPRRIRSFATESGRWNWRSGRSSYSGMQTAWRASRRPMPIRWC